jgi:hypothetical protein
MKLVVLILIKYILISKFSFNLLENCIKLLFYDKNYSYFNLNLNKSLSHSSVQNPRLVQVFLNSHLCLLHITN